MGKPKIRRYKRNPDFFEISGMGIEPVRVLDYERAVEIASARVRVEKKRRGEIPMQTYPKVDLSEIDIEI